MDWTPIVISLVAGAISILGFILGQRKDRADVAQIYEQISEKQAVKISALQTRIEENEIKYKEAIEKQQVKIDELESRVEEYEAGITLLISQLEANGVKPLWKPKFAHK